MKVPNSPPEGHSGPFETAGQVAALPAVQAVYDAYREGRTSLREGVAGLLLGACDRAGVQLGEYDRRILTWLAGIDVQGAAVVAGIIDRAGAAGRDGDQ